VVKFFCLTFLAFVAASTIFLLLLVAFFAGAMATADAFLLDDVGLLVAISLDSFLFRGSLCLVDHVLAAGGVFCCSCSLVEGLLDMTWMLESGRRLSRCVAIETSICRRYFAAERSWFGCRKSTEATPLVLVQCKKSRSNLMTFGRKIQLDQAEFDPNR
jgi:hypothetical protein